MIQLKKFLPLAGILLLLILVTTSYSSTRMPRFVLPDAVNGQKTSSSSFEGKALLLTFFATWCPPCIEEVPTLIELQNEYSDDGVYTYFMHFMMHVHMYALDVCT